MHIGTYELDPEDARIIIKRFGQKEFRLVLGSDCLEVWVRDNMSNSLMEMLDGELFYHVLGAA